MEFYKIMKSACADVDIEFDKEKYNKFMIYKDMIKEWNKKINLTAINEDEDIIKKHFIDSIKVFQFNKIKEANNIIDIGTGGGFPGLPIKIIYPKYRIVLLDSLNKRIKFLNQVIKELKLNDIETIHGRAEDFGVNKNYREKFDIAVSRAVANMSVLSEYCIPFVRVKGYFIAMKGPSIDKELKDAEKAIKIFGGRIEKVKNVNIEGSELNHNLVIVNKINKTNIRYPRKAGIASKKPIK